MHTSLKLLVTVVIFTEHSLTISFIPMTLSISQETDIVCYITSNRHSVSMIWYQIRSDINNMVLYENHKIYREYCMYANSFSAHERVIFGVFFPELWSNEGNKNQNNTRVSAETFRHENTYIILFLTWHNESINDDKTTIFTNCPRASLARFSFCEMVRLSVV